MSTVYTTSHDPPRTAARGAEFTASTKADSRTHPARTDRTSHALARPRAAQPYTRTLPYTRAPPDNRSLTRLRTRVDLPTRTVDGEKNTQKSISSIQ